MKKFNVCIVGGGSRYTPGILKMLMTQKERFPIKKLTLYDNEEERQSKVGKYAEILFREYYPEIEEFVYTTDPKAAFEDIDFALMQIRAGRLTMREQDEKISMKHGCLGQETCGPGGFAYGMRSIPAVIDIIHDIRKYSPEAWVLNYSNPAAIVAEATKRVFKDDFRIINICDMPIGIMGFYAKALGLDPKDIEPRYFGLNHFGWFTKILDKKTGEDYLPRLRKIFSEPFKVAGDLHQADKSWLETFSFMSTMINDYNDYLPNTYLQYYLYPQRMFDHENIEYTRANEVMDGNEKQVYQMLDEVIAANQLRGTKYAPAPNGADGHAGYIVDLATAIANNTSEIFLTMTENTGIISNLTEGMMVEVPCRVGSNGVEPLNIGEIPTFHKGLLENQYAYEKLTVDASLEGSYEKAFQALVLNRAVINTPTAKALLDDFIVANKGYWVPLK